MTNEMKAKRLEEWSQNEATFPRYSAKVAALLRESAALWRERESDRLPWHGQRFTEYKGFTLHATTGSDGSAWAVCKRGKRVMTDIAPTLDAAKAAAIAWVDAQEGK